VDSRSERGVPVLLPVGEDLICFLEHVGVALPAGNDTRICRLRASGATALHRRNRAHETRHVVGAPDPAIDQSEAGTRW
jgi:hypothetical protein